MSDLDEKLKSMKLKGTVYINQDDMNHYLGLSDEAVPELKQAFTEAGWITPEAEQTKRNMQSDLLKDLSSSVEKLEAHLLAPAYFGADGVIRMTGQQWYERYKTEVQNWDKSVEDLDHWDYLGAAKRAAGMEDKQ